MNFSFLPLRRKHKNLFSGALVLAALYLLGYYFVTKAFIPDNFTTARHQSALIAKEVVALTEESLTNLDKIALQDRQYNFGQALRLVREELERAQNSRLKAVDLTRELDGMARAAAGIKPAKLRNLAISAISNELSLISHLIVYNDILNGLLQTLEFKFSGDINYKSEEVQILIKNMNQEAKEINNLNEAFNEKMKKFDELVN